MINHISQAQARFPLGDKRRYLAIFGDNFPTIFDNNLDKNLSLGSHYNKSNLNFETFLISCLTLKRKTF